MTALAQGQCGRHQWLEVPAGPTDGDEKKAAHRPIKPGAAPCLFLGVPDQFMTQALALLLQSDCTAQWLLVVEMLPLG